VDLYTTTILVKETIIKVPRLVHVTDFDKTLSESG